MKSDSYFLHTHGDHVRVFTQSDVRTHNRALSSEQHLDTTVALHAQTAGIWHTPTAAGTPQNANGEFRTVADPGFPRGEGANQNEPTPKVDVKSYYLANFSQKLHKIEKIWTPRWGRPSLAPSPLDPQMQKEMHKLLRQQRGK